MINSESSVGLLTTSHEGPAATVMERDDAIRDAADAASFVRIKEAASQDDCRLFTVSVSVYQSSNDAALARIVALTSPRGHVCFVLASLAAILKSVSSPTVPMELRQEFRHSAQAARLQL